MPELLVASHASMAPGSVTVGLTPSELESVGYLPPARSRDIEFKRLLGDARNVGRLLATAGLLAQLLSPKAVGELLSAAPADLYRIEHETCDGSVYTPAITAATSHNEQSLHARRPAERFDILRSGIALMALADQIAAMPSRDTDVRFTRHRGDTSKYPPAYPEVVSHCVESKLDEGNRRAVTKAFGLPLSATRLGVSLLSSTRSSAPDNHTLDTIVVTTDAPHGQTSHGLELGSYSLPDGTVRAVVRPFQAFSTRIHPDGLGYPVPQPPTDAHQPIESMAIALHAARLLSTTR